MSLLQYGFKRQRINDSSSQENEQNSKNSQENLKNSNMKNKFVTEGATNISKKSAVKEHVKCKDHIEAEKLETTRIQMESLQNQIFSSDANARHIIIIMRAVYFLSKKDLPLQLLPSIIEIMKESGTPHISDGSITYTNEISGHEFLMVIAKTIEDKIWNVYFSYVAKNGTFKTHFLCLLPLTDYDAESITQVLINIFKKKGILSKLVAFASDGASVMLGKDEGVAAKLSRVCTYPLIVNDCVAHKLALACKDPRDSEDLLCFSDNELEDLLKYYEYPNIHNNIQSTALFDVNKCRQEWVGFKMVVINNLFSKDINIILPLLIQDYSDIFPNIIKLIQLIYCISFSSVEYERDFSRQNQIKTKNRNSLATDTLDMLMRVSLEGPESSKFDYDRAYIIWKSQKRRTSINK
ncbi:5491_t:CDS:2 [Funneliformis geosporum]|uniref:5491_t:CDS:1 n=1 Tax=Funneliformis geosporum TaxID=1117311 RepID=A0A9W4SKW5_9GLOM|nr:5491_t:CDS:2 [Funneliformis geosporum]